MCRLFPAMLSVLGVLALAPVASGQGTFVFGNARSAIGGVGAPVGFLGDLRPGSPAGGPVDRVAGNQWLAQAVINDVPWPGTVQPFRTGGAAGFIVNQNVFLDGYAPGTAVSIQLAAWWAGLGPTYLAEWSWGQSLTGISNPVTVTLADPSSQPPPTLAGLLPFMIMSETFWLPPIIPDIPEPSALPLAATALVVCLVCRGRHHTP